MWYDSRITDGHMKLLPRSFRFSPTLCIASVLFAVVAFQCSAWQWKRYHWKTALVETYDRNRTDASSTELTAAMLTAAPGSAEIPSKQSPVEQDLKELLHHRVQLRGRYDYDREVIITNRKLAVGERGDIVPGYHLCTPFFVAGGSNSILVCRGFIPFADRDPSSWAKYHPNNAELASAAPEVTVDAVVQESVSPSWLNPQNPDVGEGKPFATTWLYPETSKMAKQLPYPMNGQYYVQRIGQSEVGGPFPAEAISIQVPASTHFGYTIEWALLGIGGLVLAIVIQCRPKKRLASEREWVQTAANAAVFFVSTFVAAFFALAAPSAYATDDAKQVMVDTGVDNKLNTQIDLSIEFTGADGVTKPLRAWMLDNRPFIITPVYYRCPSLCTLTLEGVVRSLNDLPLKLGTDFKILTVSINPSENQELASKKASNYFKALTDPEDGPRGWEFLTGSGDNIQRLMGQLGFRYKPDGAEFSHSPSIMIITPDGKISRYFNDVLYPARDLRLALVEASEGKIGTTFDRVMLFCFRYDDYHGRYTLAAMNLMRAGCGIVAVVLLFVLLRMRLREKKEIQHATVDSRLP